MITKQQLEEWEVITSYVIECLNSIPNRTVNHDGENKPVKLYDIIPDLELVNKEISSHLHNLR